VSKAIRDYSLTGADARHAIASGRVRDPSHFVKRELPPTAQPFVPATAATPAE